MRLGRVLRMGTGRENPGYQVAVYCSGSGQESGAGPTTTVGGGKRFEERVSSLKG